MQAAGGRITRIFLLVCMILGSATGAISQSRSDSVIVQRFHIYYPINETELHEDYHSNSISLKIIEEHFRKSPKIDSIVIYSYASPEGPYAINKRLAEIRGKRARQYLLKHFPPDRNFPDSLIVVNSTAENWDGLYDLVKDRYPYSDKQDILDLLGRKNISNDRKKLQLKQINGGKPWRFIRSEILPQLRYATWVAEWVHVPVMWGGLEPVDTKIKQDTLAYRNLPTTLEWCKPPVKMSEDTVKTILALKTNLLYDVVSFLNFSVEAPLYKDRMSFLYYHQFPWWTWGEASNEYCARFLSIGAEARYWFISKGRFNGHFLGAYAESGKYDFEFQRHICYQGEFSTAGLSYGYAKAIGRNLNLEFSLSVGYASIAYRGFTPSEDYEILWKNPDEVGRWHYVGPTKAQISLVIPIKAKFKKGGER